jgi:[protein-PII] uridylyltransferase
VVDIRAVGPGVWNSWKRQLLRDLFEAAEETLRLGHKQKGREDRIAAAQEALAARSAGTPAASPASPGASPKATGWPSLPK